MANQTGVFTPPDASTYEGPFSSAIAPPPVQQPQPLQQGPASKAGGIMLAANAFIQGAAQARAKSFQQKENQKLQSLNRLNQYMTQVYPTLTPDAQKQAMAVYSKAIGQETLTAIGDQKKGKGDKGGQPGLAGHFTNALKDLATGMVGGKLPKGAPSVDTNSVIGQLAVISSNPKNTREGVISSNEAEIKNKLKDFNGSYEEGLKLVAPHLSAIAGLDEQRGRTMHELYLGGYQKAPQVGTDAWIYQQEHAGNQPAPPPGPDYKNYTLGVGSPHEDKPQVPASGKPEGTASNAPMDLGPTLNYSRYGAPQRINVSNPQNPAQQMSAILNPRTNLLEDSNGIPLPPAQQGWLKETTPYHPPQTDKKIAERVRSEDGKRWVDVFQSADGTKYEKEVYTPPARDPNAWKARFSATQAAIDARDFTKATQQVNAKYISEKISINRTFDAQIAKVKGDPLQAKAAEATIKGIEEERQQRLGELEEDTKNARDALRSKPEGQRQPAPPPGPGGKTAVTPQAKSILPF